MTSTDNHNLSLTSCSGLKIEATTSQHSALLELFFRDYDAAFVLPNEKESLEGFAECLSLNNGEDYARLRQLYGAFREFVLIATDPASGQRIGGANFIAFPLRGSSGTVLSLNLNYVFVNPSARRRGYFGRLVRDLPDLALQCLLKTNGADLPPDWQHSPPQILMFIEQNDPFRMSAEDYKADTKYTGLDQIERIRIWARLGAKIVDFVYAQPPLTSDQEADHNLAYGVLGTDGGALDACLLRGHLERFFGISVLKGADPMSEPTAATQIKALEPMCERGEPVTLLAANELSEKSESQKTLRAVLAATAAGARETRKNDR